MGRCGARADRRERSKGAVGRDGEVGFGSGLAAALVRQQGGRDASFVPLHADRAAGAETRAGRADDGSPTRICSSPQNWPPLYCQENTNTVITPRYKRFSRLCTAVSALPAALTDWRRTASASFRCYARICTLSAVNGALLTLSSQACSGKLQLSPGQIRLKAVLVRTAPDQEDLLTQDEERLSTIWA